MKRLVILFAILLISLLTFGQAKSARYITVSNADSQFLPSGAAGGTIVTDESTWTSYLLIANAPPTGTLNTTPKLVYESSGGGAGTLQEVTELGATTDRDVTFTGDDVSFENTARFDEGILTQNLEVTGTSLWFGGLDIATIISKGSRVPVTKEYVSQAISDSLAGLGGSTETDPIYSADPAFSIDATDITNLRNLSGTNTGDETTATIQTKRPLKTINSTSLEGAGNILIEGGSGSGVMPIFSGATGNTATQNATALLSDVIGNKNLWIKEGAFLLDDVVLPAGITLYFAEGAIFDVTGTLTGNFTKIRAGANQIFTLNSNLDGTWAANNGVAYPEWFDNGDYLMNDEINKTIEVFNKPDTTFTEGLPFEQNNIKISQPNAVRLTANEYTIRQVNLIPYSNVELSYKTRINIDTNNYFGPVFYATQSPFRLVGQSASIRVPYYSQQTGYAASAQDDAAKIQYAYNENPVIKVWLDEPAANKQPPNYRRRGIEIRGIEIRPQVEYDRTDAITPYLLHDGLFMELDTSYVDETTFGGGLVWRKYYRMVDIGDGTSDFDNIAFTLSGTPGTVGWKFGIDCEYPCTYAPDTLPEPTSWGNGVVLRKYPTSSYFHIVSEMTFNNCDTAFFMQGDITGEGVCGISGTDFLFDKNSAAIVIGERSWGNLFLNTYIQVRPGISAGPYLPSIDIRGSLNQITGQLMDPHEQNTIMIHTGVLGTVDNNIQLTTFGGRLAEDYTTYDNYNLMAANPVGFHPTWYKSQDNSLGRNNSFWSRNDRTGFKDPDNETVDLEDAPRAVVEIVGKGQYTADPLLSIQNLTGAYMADGTVSSMTGIGRNIELGFQPHTQNYIRPGMGAGISFVAFDTLGTGKARIDADKFEWGWLGVRQVSTLTNVESGMKPNLQYWYKTAGTWANGLTIDEVGRMGLNGTTNPAYTVDASASGTIRTTNLTDDGTDISIHGIKYPTASGTLDQILSFDASGDLVAKDDETTSAYTPEDFNAAGDGVTDDTQAMKDFFEYLWTNDVPGEFTEGATYLTTDEVFVLYRGNVRVDGKNAKWIRTYHELEMSGDEDFLSLQQHSESQSKQLVEKAYKGATTLVLADNTGIEKGMGITMGNGWSQDVNGDFEIETMGIVTSVDEIDGQSITIDTPLPFDFKLKYITDPGSPLDSTTCYMGYLPAYRVDIRNIDFEATGGLFGTPTSTNTITIPTTHPTTVSFTGRTGMSYYSGLTIKLQTSTGEFFNTEITSYDSGTGAFVTESLNNTGTGTFSSWAVVRLPLLYGVFRLTKSFYPVVENINVSGGGRSAFSFNQCYSPIINDCRNFDADVTVYALLHNTMIRGLISNSSFYAQTPAIVTGAGCSFDNVYDNVTSLGWRTYGFDSHGALSGKITNSTMNGVFLSSGDWTISNSTLYFSDSEDHTLIGYGNGNDSVRANITIDNCDIYNDRGRKTLSYSSNSGGSSGEFNSLTMINNRIHSDDFRYMALPKEYWRNNKIMVKNELPYNLVDTDRETAEHTDNPYMFINDAATVTGLNLGDAALTDGFTAMVKFRTDGTGNQQTIMGGNVDSYFQVTQDDGTYRLRYRDVGGTYPTDGVNSYGFQTSNPVSTGDSIWRTITVSIDANGDGTGTINMYLEGRSFYQFTGATYTSLYVSVSNFFKIGGATSTNNFDGDIESALFFDRPLSNREVSFYSADMKRGRNSDAIGQWLDLMDDTNWTDESGNGYTGVVGATSIVKNKDHASKEYFEQIIANSPDYPVLDLTRTTSAGNAYYGAAEINRVTDVTPSDGMGVAFYFRGSNDADEDTRMGMFGGGLSDVSDGAEIGELVFSPSYLGADPGAERHFVIKAKSASTSTFDMAGDVTMEELNISSPSVPTTASSTGTAGDIVWDSDYIYICTATDTWKRVAIATW